LEDDDIDDAVVLFGAAGFLSAFTASQEDQGDE
jgi:hypothetical protein